MAAKAAQGLILAALTAVSATSLAQKAADAPPPIDPARAKGRFAGVWHEVPAHNRDAAPRGTLTLVHSYDRLCGIWETGSGKGAKRRVVAGKVNAKRDHAEVWIADLDPSGRQPVAWKGPTGVSNAGHLMTSSLLEEGMRFAYKSLDVKVDKAFNAACARNMHEGFTPPSPRQAQLRCEIDGKPVEFQPRPDHVVGKTGKLRCFKDDFLLSESQIRDGKWIGVRVRYHETGGRREESVNERGMPDGAQRDFHANGKLKSEGVLREGQPAGRKVTYHPDGKPEAIEYHDRGPRERVEYDARGRVSDLLCNPGINYLPEIKVDCGFDPDTPGIARTYGGNHERMLTHVKGRKVKSVSYWDAFGGQVRTVVEMKDGFEKHQSFFKDGKPELESVIAVDARGEKRQPRDETYRSFYPSGKREAEVRLAGKLETEDWWHENGRKKREVRSEHGTTDVTLGDGRKQRMKAIIKTTREFAADGTVTKDERQAFAQM